MGGGALLFIFGPLGASPAGLASFPAALQAELPPSRCQARLPPHSTQSELPRHRAQAVLPKRPR